MSSNKQIWGARVFSIVIVLVSVVTLLQALYVYKQFSSCEVDTDPLIVMFLDEFLGPTYNEDKGLFLFPTYFLSLKDAMPGEDATIREDESLEQNLFQQVFYRYKEIYDGYELEIITNEFVKVTPRNIDGSLDYPSIGVWYTIKGRKIDTWRIARLEPFDSHDYEYSEDWSEY